MLDRVFLRVRGRCPVAGTQRTGIISPRGAIHNAEIARSDDQLKMIITRKIREGI